MKRLLILSLCFSILLSFCACDIVRGTSSDNSSKTSSSADSKQYDGVTLTVDTHRKSWLSSLPTGIQEAVDIYGFNVSYRMHTESEYVKDIKSYVAANLSSDICDVANFSEFSELFGCLMPITSTGLNVDDLLDQSILYASAVNGDPYLVNGYGNPLQYIDVCLYNKAIFKEAELTSPKEFYNKGEWTIENFKWCAEKITALGNEYVGAVALEEAPYAVSRDSYFALDNGKLFLNSKGKIEKVADLFYQMKKSGSLKPYRGGFGDNKCGMFLTNSKALVVSGYLSNLESEEIQNIGITYLPKPEDSEKQSLSASFGGWGIVKSTQYPEAAGLLLKHFLQPKDKSSAVTGHNFTQNDAFADFYSEIFSDGSVDIDYYIAPHLASTKFKVSLSYDLNDDTVKDINRYYKDKQEDMQKVCDEANKLLK